MTVGVHDVEEADNVGVVHLLEQRDLANGCGRDALVLCLETDLLESNNALVLGGKIASFVDDSVRAWFVLTKIRYVGTTPRYESYLRQSSPSSDNSPYWRKASKGLFR